MNTYSSALIKKPFPLFCLCFSVFSFSDDYKAVDENHLEHIVISGTRTPKLLSDSPVSIQVIDQETIQILTHGTLANALNYIPGLVVTRNVKDGYNIQMQGFDGDHVLVLVNSQPLISPAGSAADLDQINANDIERIEVLRGAASVMYGSSAMGGVINIITKDVDKSKLKISLQASQYVDALEDDSIQYTTRVNANLTVEDWNYKISLLHIDDTGFDYDPETISQDANGMKKSFINLSGKSKSFGLFGNDEVNAEVKYQYLTEDKSRPTARVPGQGSIIKYLSEVEQNQFDLSLNTDVFNDEQHKIQQGSLQLNGRYINHQEVSGQTSGIRDTEINIPFTPINSDKIFSSTLHIEDLFTALTLHCQQKDINSWHILYCNEVNTALPNDVYQRNTVQFHWFNRDYQSFDNFLHSFTSRKRKNTRKERLSISQQGLKTRQLKGNKITPKDIDFFYLTYQLTYLKRGHQPHLSFNFFKQIFNRMSENILLIIASDEKEDVACALFLYNNSHLYGRYWGCTKAYSNLHFELCYYLGIEFCIKNKISTFNPGTQGEHKIKRGFEPVLTHSYHWIKHPTFKEPIKNFCKQEQQHMLTYQQQCQQLLPFKK